MEKMKSQNSPKDLLQFLELKLTTLQGKFTPDEINFIQRLFIDGIKRDIMPKTLVDGFFSKNLGTQRMFLTIIQQERGDLGGKFRLLLNGGVRELNAGKNMPKRPNGRGVRRRRGGRA